MPLLKAGSIRVPDHIHLLFLPPYSPELQPAEHFWALLLGFAAADHLPD